MDRSGEGEPLSAFCHRVKETRGAAGQAHQESCRAQPSTKDPDASTRVMTTAQEGVILRVWRLDQAVPEIRRREMGHILQDQRRGLGDMTSVSAARPARPGLGTSYANRRLAPALLQLLEPPGLAPSHPRVPSTRTSPAPVYGQSPVAANFFLLAHVQKSAPVHLWGARRAHIVQAVGAASRVPRGVLGLPPRGEIRVQRRRLRVDGRGRPAERVALGVVRSGWGRRDGEGLRSWRATELFVLGPRLVEGDLAVWWCAGISHCLQRELPTM